MEAVRRIVLAAGILFLAGCFPEGARPRESKHPPAQGTIAIVGSDLSQSRIRHLASHAAERADEMGYEVVVYDLKGDPAQSTAVVRALMERGPAAVLWNPFPTGRGLPEFENIPAVFPIWILDERPLEVDSSVVAQIFVDEVKGGKRLGEIVAEQAGGLAGYVEMFGDREMERVRRRLSGFHSVVDEIADLERLRQIQLPSPSGDPAQVLNLVEALPHGSMLVCLDEDSTSFMIRRPRISGVRVYGVGGTETVRAAVKTGRLQAALFPRCDLVGRTAVEWAHQHLVGERGMPRLQPVTPALITPQNVDQYRDYGFVGADGE